MFTFGWIEIFLIVIIIVVVIGPKDLPKFIKQITNLPLSQFNFLPPSHNIDISFE